MKAITVDWLSCSKFGSALPTSQTALIPAEMMENDHGVDYRGWPTRPLIEPENVFDVADYLQAGPDPTALQLGLQRHEPPERNYTPRRVAPAVVCLRLNAEAGSLHDDW
jgi:hypothetical protein